MPVGLNVGFILTPPVFFLFSFNAFASYEAITSHSTSAKQPLKTKKPTTAIAIMGF